MVFFTGIFADDLDRVWNVVAPMLKVPLARDNGIYTIDDVYEGIKTRKMQLWVAADDGEINACMVSIIHEHAHTKIAHIFVLGGDSVEAFLAAKASWGHFELWASRMGCKFIEANARPGISRLTKSIGFLKHSEVIRKELNPVTLQ